MTKKPNGIALQLAIILLIAAPACSSTRSSSDKAEDIAAAELELQGEFWWEFTIDGEWAEYHPTFQDMVASADLVALVTITDLSEPFLLQGDASGDHYQEENLVLKIDDLLAGPEGAESAVLTLVARDNPNEERRDWMRGVLPIKAFVLLRQRDDRDIGVYTVVNGFGLWANTPRAAVDCPIEMYNDHCLWRDELVGIETIEQLANSLRP